MNSVQQTEHNKVSIMDSALHKIKAEFSCINNLPNSTEHPLWDKIHKVCNLTLAEVVALMNVRCSTNANDLDVAAPIPTIPIKTTTITNAVTAPIIIKGTTFIHLHFDVVIQIAELLPLDTIVSLYIAIKKIQLLATNYDRQARNLKEALIMVINKKISAAE